MSLFEWNEKKEKAAILLAEGHTIDEAAKQVCVSSRTIDRWKSDIDFSSEVDRLSLMIGIANKAERLRIAKRMVSDLLKKSKPTDKDLLEWLKYAQSETDGIKLDLAAIFEALTSVAGGRPEGTDTEAEPEEKTQDQPEEL